MLPAVVSPPFPVLAPAIPAPGSVKWGCDLAFAFAFTLALAFAFAFAPALAISLVGFL